MFNFKLSAFAISALMLSTVNALTLGVPVDRTIGATTTANQIWAYYGTLATPVDPAPGVVTVTIPAGIAPATDYVLKAVYVDNFDHVISQSPVFTLIA